MKQKLSIENLIKEAQLFCINQSKFQHKELFGVTDGKAVGTLIEQKFQAHLLANYELTIGSSAMGIDLPSEDLLTDIKVTSNKLPQSSCPFRDAKQKIFGLGYNLLVFVYDKTDDPDSQTATLNFVSCSFVSKERTSDFTTTSILNKMKSVEANEDDIISFLEGIKLPADEITLKQIAEIILTSEIPIGYLTISNALQWRLQYGRIRDLKNDIPGIDKIISFNKPK
jgi:hypothetical protein